MIVEINEEQAKAILDSASCCFRNRQDCGDLKFLLDAIKEAFPNLWAQYKYLEEP